MAFTPGQEALPPTTPGGLATGVNGERLGATDIAADGTKGASVTADPTADNTLTFYKPKSLPQGGDSQVARFPSDPAAENNSDFVVFSFFKYAPPFGGSVEAPAAVAGENGNGVNQDTSTNANNTYGYSNYQSSNDRAYQNESDIKPIILYMPEDIQAEYGANWAGAGFGAAAAGMLNAMGSLGPGQDIGQKVQTFAETIPGVVKTATFDKMIKAINQTAGAQVSLNQALGSISGTILNPNTELLYEAPKLRQFTLNFKMSPRTGKEAQNIAEICNRFKKAMLPKFGGSALFGTSEAGNLLTIPDLCQVSFMKGDGLHPYLPQYKLCAITSVAVNYTPDGAYATFGDGSPVATSLSITFLETKLIFANEVTSKGSSVGNPSVSV